MVFTNYKNYQDEKIENKFIKLQIAINNFCKKASITRDQFKSTYLANFGVKSTKELNQNQTINLIKQLQFSPQPIF